MLFRHSVSVLALLLILSAISGCKRQVTTSVSTAGDIELSPYHTPIIYVYEGQVLRWRPSSGAVAVTFDQGLCKESGPLHGTHDQPAVCTIAKQTFDDDKPNIYTLTVSGSDAVQYQIYVKRCIGCP